MSRCPYCQKIANPLRFFSYSRWSPYRCPGCGKKSEFGMLGLIISGTLGAVVATIAEGVFDLPLIATIVVGIVIILGLMNLLKLRPKEMPSEQMHAEATSKTAPSAVPEASDA